jgi:hypothetical protein
MFHQTESQKIPKQNSHYHEKKIIYFLKFALKNVNATDICHWRCTYNSKNFFLNVHRPKTNYIKAMEINLK